ncbi:MAG: 30S ribosomal protein S2 [candidate division WOR-3 bacterium]
MEEPREGAVGNTPSADLAPVSLKSLLEAGVHFGHPRQRWNPKMREFIFTERGGVHIIDLRKTLPLLLAAYDKMRDVAFRGGNILFVGTKKQAREVVREEAERAGVFHVTERWPGGLLTNFETIRKRLTRMRELEELVSEMEGLRAGGKTLPYTKKELSLMEKELYKLQRLFGGIRDMEVMPDIMFVVDVVQEDIAIREARKLGIPITALLDTNSDPTIVDYPIPGNDDAIRSIKLVTETMANAVLEGRGGKQPLRSQ